MARTKDAVLAPGQQELIEKEYLDFVNPSTYGNKANPSSCNSLYDDGIIIIIGTADQQPHVFCKFLAAFGIIFSLCIDCSLFCLITLTGEAG